MSEFDLFLEELGGVKPLKQSASNTTTQKKAALTEEQIQQRRENAERSAAFDPNPLMTENVELVDPDDLLSYKKSGVQDGVFKNLRLGKYEIHTVLNIQGQSIKQARQNVYLKTISCFYMYLLDLCPSETFIVYTQRMLLQI